MANRVKKTKNQIALGKEIKRINRFIKRAEKRGFTFDVKLPTIKKRVTKKDIDKAKSLTPEKLYKSASYKTETGKIVPGTEGRKIERSRAAKKGARTKSEKGIRPPRPPKGVKYSPPSQAEDVYRFVKDMVFNWEPSPNWTPAFIEIKRTDKNTLYNILRGAIDRDGLFIVSQRLEENAARVKDLCWYICYGESGDKYHGVQTELVELANIINGSPVSSDEADYLHGYAGDGDAE